MLTGKVLTILIELRYSSNYSIFTFIDEFGNFTRFSKSKPECTAFKDLLSEAVSFAQE